MSVSTEDNGINWTNSIHEFGINPSTREIWLSPINNGEDDVDAQLAERLIKNIRILESANDKPILIHMACGGGDISYGLAIYDAIERSQCYITILVYGLASSMSSVILQGADYRVLMPHSHVFIHDVDISTNGSINAVRSDVSQWNTDNNRIYDIYTERCQNGSYFKERNYNRSKIKAYLRRKGQSGYFLMPSEAVEIGLADSILGVGDHKNVGDLLT